MKITCLMENISHHEELKCQHGLSLYIETKQHRILLDTGADASFAENAQKLGVNLKDVDIAFLSHGHYDHAGGISRFLQLNHTASVYIKQEAFEDYCHNGSDGYEYIGVDNVRLETGDLTADALRNHPQVVLVSGDLRIDEELSLMTDVTEKICWPSTNRSLLIRTENGYAQDYFPHEQSLIIGENGKHVLISGCAHCGIVNILNRYSNLHEGTPDVAISGFHLERSKPYHEEQKADVVMLGKELQKYSTKFYTCHCTGQEAYGILKNIMHEQICYLSVGDVIDI